MAVKIIVDSTADLTAALKENCTVVPLTLRFGEEEFVDGVTITHKEFYEKLVSSSGLFLLAEFLMIQTFSLDHFIGWSLYPMSTLFLLGSTLIFLAICRSARTILYRKVFF